MLTVEGSLISVAIDSVSQCHTVTSSSRYLREFYTINRRIITRITQGQNTSFLYQIRITFLKICREILACTNQADADARRGGADAESLIFKSATSTLYCKMTSSSSNCTNSFSATARRRRTLWLSTVRLRTPTLTMSRSKVV